MKNYITPLLLVVTIVVLLLIAFRKPKQVYNYSTKNLTKVIERTKEKVDSARVKTTYLKNEVTYYKSVFDTVNIVRYQDSVITYQDTQIVYLNQIVEKQDTLIDLLKFDNKRLKRQRNILIGVSGILGTIAILK